MEVHLLGIATKAHQQAGAGITQVVQPILTPRIAAEGALVAGAASVGDGLATLAATFANDNARLAGFKVPSPRKGGTQSLGTKP